MNAAAPPVCRRFALLFALLLLAHVAVASPPAPDMTLTKTHSGNFTQGDTGDVYTLTATNSGTKPTTGTITVVDTLPSGLTATAMSGPGWSCTLATLTCTRSDSLPANTGYQIALTVDVANNAPASVVNNATVSGGGETNTGNDAASDPTTITQKIPDLSMDVFHSGTFSEGDTGKTYSLRVDNSNIGGFPTDGSTVTVVDSVTSGLSVTAIAGTGWNCTLATLTCTRNDVLPNFTTYPNIIVTVDVALNATTPQTNQATVSGGGDQNTANNTWGDVTTIVQKPDLAINLSHSGVWALGATGKTYGISVANVGGIATDGSTVTVVDTLPTGLTATAISGSGWGCTLGTLTCTRSDALANAASYPPITVTVTVANNAPANLTNIATVSGGGETDTANDTANDPTQTLQADLVLVKTHSGTWNPGDTGKTYTLTASNAGASPTDASTVSVVDTLPAGLTATAITGSGWGCTLGSLTCTRSDVLAANSSYPDITLTVNVANNALPSVVNTATVAGGGEIDTSNDAASDDTTINEPDLTANMFVGTPMSQGQGFASYFLIIQNIGTQATSGQVNVVDSLPTGLTANMINGTGWSCTLATLTCTRSDALPGGSSYPPINLFVSVDHDAPTSVMNTVTVSGGGEIDTSNDSFSKTTAVTQKPDVSVTKSHVGIWHQNDAGRNYTITVANAPYADTTGTVTLVDTLPTGLTASAISGTGWGCTLGTLTCTRSDVLTAGATYPDITVTVNVDATAAALVTNTATVSGGGQIYTANDVANDDTTISSSGPGIDLAIQVNDGTNGKKFFVGGQQADYTITVQNLGTVDAHAASVQDLLPANLISATWDCVPASGASCTASGSGSITDTVTIPQGASLTYHLTATVKALPEAAVVNTASVSTGTGETDTNLTNNSASATDAVGIFRGDFEGP
jgi:uncharacterized repeat protein (TIGR01451 family)